MGKNIISASLTVTNLGIVLDRNLTMAYQVSKIVRICTYKLRMVNNIRDKLSVHVAERVVNAMVTGNLAYCNSLLHGITAGLMSHIGMKRIRKVSITAGQLERLQKIQNTAAILILRRNRRSSATVMLHELHWRPIKKLGVYKRLLMVYKFWHDMVPDYITAHFLDFTKSHLLRSSEDRQLVVIKTHSHYGDISFQLAKLWNAAHFQLKSIQNMDSFKSKLKTYLFMFNILF